MINFNEPCLSGSEEDHILKSIRNPIIAGDGEFTKKCHTWFEEKLQCHKVFLTPSCTHALEMAAILLNIKDGDEVIMPSYTFVSTANAFVLRGAKIIFVDIRKDTMNIDETKIEEAITKKTKAIVPVHYAGVGCDMDLIMKLANQYKLYVVEDAAQGMMSSYKGKQLGTIGHIGAYSFHETKNYTSGGEGGLLVINDEQFSERADIIRQKGTNRALFYRGMVDKYSWVDVGSSYLMNDISAAYLWGNLENADDINQNRLLSWNKYQDGLNSLEKEGHIKIQHIPDDCTHNAHMFYFKVADLKTRTSLLEHLKSNNISAVFHYIPLHSSPAGLAFGRMVNDIHTTQESETLIRLPMYFGLKEEDIKIICNSIANFFYKN
ncbi:dTDP-4-amino-4,6-dideoxygalactose transaminase [Gammaproteobacteria bacterium]|nr:dTDP-4-amino-4,6-dideoxygalactose transaminase [Gammaproteobacteria bacterium]